MLPVPNQALAIEALRNQLRNLEQSIGRLHQVTLLAPRSQIWNQVRDEVSGLDSIADVVRQVLDWVEEKE